MKAKRDKEKTKKKVAYSVTNWKDYNQALKQRGSLTVSLSEDLEENWLAPLASKSKRGRPFRF